jgi:hypothetical protein
MSFTSELQIFRRCDSPLSGTVNDFTLIPNTPSFAPLQPSETPGCELSVDIFSTYEEACGFKLGYERAVSRDRWSLVVESASFGDRPLFAVLIVDENSADDCIRMTDHRPVLRDNAKVQCASLTSTS